MPIRLPINRGPTRADALRMRGSMRQRSAGSWELRVFVGVDPGTGRRRYRSVTVRGNRAEADRELAAMVAGARAVRDVGMRSRMSDLLEAWFGIASTTWAPTTIRQTRSVLDRYLHPHLGDGTVGDLTAAEIDRIYALLRRRGGMQGQPLAAGTLARIHVVLAPRSRRLNDGAGSGTIPPNARTAL